MSEHCGFNIFEDCNCGGECRSGTVNLGKFAKSTDRTLNTVLAKDRAGWAVRYGASVAIAIAALSIIASFLLIAVPKGERQALIDRENVHVVAR